ncbi:MAG TPA: hypothetical protein VFK57_18900 [Vicinamibacterales bacterium]|nr:hypothetical protein [Vicinamibacterales bacterium]
MTDKSSALLWAPRLTGIGMSLFLALFALDAFDGKPLAAALPAFLMHLLPALIVAATVAVAWRYPLAGAAAFAFFALAYAVMVRGRLDWIAVIAGPLAAVAGLFFLSWRVSPHGR